MSSLLEGRFYEAEFPELEEIVVVQVKRIVDMGAYATLLEYNGKQGLILPSELSKRRIHSVSKLLRVGRIEICMIMCVDKEKGCIDLSKRRVDPEQATAKEEAFAKAKAVHGIMRHVASLHGLAVEELCRKVSWPLHKRHGDAHEAFRRHINEEIDLWKELDFSQPGQDLSHLAEKLKTDLDVHLRRRLAQQVQRLRAKIEVTCNEYEGVDAIKAALLRGLEASSEDCEVQVHLVAHPLFALTCICRDKAQGKEALQRAMELVQEAIEARGGAFEIHSLPVLIGHEPDPSELFGSCHSSGAGGDSTESEQDESMGNVDESEVATLLAKELEEDED